MSAPIPGSWIKKETKPKKPFVLREHLNTKPLRDDPRLKSLKKTLIKEGNK